MKKTLFFILLVFGSLLAKAQQIQIGNGTCQDVSVAILAGYSSTCDAIFKSRVVLVRAGTIVTYDMYPTGTNPVPWSGFPVMPPAPPSGPAVDFRWVEMHDFPGGTGGVSVGDPCSPFPDSNPVPATWPCGSSVISNFTSPSPSLVTVNILP